MPRFVLLAVVLTAINTPLPAEDTKVEPFDAATALKAASQPLDNGPGKKLSSFSVAQSLQDKTSNSPVLIALSRDGKRLLAYGKGYQVYDAQTGKLVSKEPLKPLPTVPGHTVISPDGKVVACVASKQFIALEVETGKELTSADIGETKFAHVAFVGNRTCQLLGRDTVLREIPIGKGDAKAYPPPKANQLKELVAFSATGNRFVNVPPDRTSPWNLFLVHNGGVGWTGIPLQRPQQLDMVAVSDHFLVHGNPAFGNLYVVRFEIKIPSVEFQGLGTSPLRAGSTGDLEDLSISTDEQWLLRTTQKLVEVRSLDTPKFPRVHKVDLGHGYQAAAPDAMRVAGITFNDVVVYQLPAAQESPATAFIRLLSRLLRDKQFEELEQLAALIAEEEKPFPWAVDQEKYNALVQLLVSAVGPDLTQEKRIELLDEWFKHRPDAPLIRIVQAQQALNKGWQARGSGLASSVSREGWRVFGQQVEKAHELIKPLLDEDNPPPEAYVSLFEIAKAQSWSEEDCEPHIAKLLKLNPRYLAPHVAMTEKLMPRWGGEPGADGKYVARVADAIGGENGDVAYAKLATKIAIYETKEAFFDEAGFDYNRIQRGWTAVQKDKANADFGMIGEAVIAKLKGDKERLAKARNRILDDELIYVPGIVPNPRMFNDMMLSSDQ
jgi:hypothetical protein